MAPIKIPKLRAARAPRRVAMPRFRGKTAGPVTLTEAVHRVLKRARLNPEPFGVFAISGKLMMSNVQTDRFKTWQRRSPDAFVGTYDGSVKVADVIDDLRLFYSDEVTHDGA